MSISISWILLTAATLLAPSCSSAPAQSYRENAGFSELQRVVGARKARLAYPEIPSVTELHLPHEPPQKITPHEEVSPGLGDPLLEEARSLAAYEDFKPLSDARKKTLNAPELQALQQKAERAGDEAASKTSTPSPESAPYRKAFLREWIDGAYLFGGELIPVQDLTAPLWKISSPDPAIEKAFDYTEKTLSKLIRRTPPQSAGSLLPNPYPFAIPAGRFQEAYYWDSYFGLMGILATQRLKLGQMQVENFLEAVRTFGLVPNGMRDYYLTRSQPPFLSSMVRDVFEATVKNPEQVAHAKEWLEKRAYPLMKLDYQKFWMNPATHYDVTTGLNHHWDDLNLPRPERHASDDDTKLGLTYRDVRAAAESGLDFTEGFDHEASRVAGTLLNGMLYMTELNLAWAAEKIGKVEDAKSFTQAALKRRQAVDKYLWNSQQGRYEEYNLRKAARVSGLMADSAVPLFVGMASPEQAKSVRQALKKLEKKGGIASSDFTRSSYQWDGDIGWAPLNVMAIQGLRNYGYESDAKRIALKWVKMIATIHQQTAVMYERMNVATAAKPAVDETKYPPQEGFLWTNESYVWALTQVLNVPLQKLK